MNRYFLVHDLHLPSLEPEEGRPFSLDFGVYHTSDLAGHGPAGDSWNLLMLTNSSVVPCISWLPLPSLYDQRTKIIDVLPYNILEDLGIDAEESPYTLDLMEIFRPINPIMSS